MSISRNQGGQRGREEFVAGYRLNLKVGSWMTRRDVFWECRLPGPDEDDLNRSDVRDHKMPCQRVCAGVPSAWPLESQEYTTPSPGHAVVRLFERLRWPG